MRNIGLFPEIRVTHCSDHPFSARPGHCPRLSPFPAKSPRVFLTPLPAANVPRRAGAPPTLAAQRAQPRRRQGAGPARRAHPRVGAGQQQFSGAPGLPTGLLRRLAAGPLPAQILRPLFAALQPRGSGICSRAAPLHTSPRAPPGAVGETLFSPLPETDFLHFISPHRPSGSKMLTFSGGQQTQLTLIYPSNGERLYYKPLAAVPSLGPTSNPVLVPQTLI